MSGRAVGLRGGCEDRSVHIATVEPCKDVDLAKRLLAVQRAAYQVEASVIGDDRIPALHEDVEELCAAPLSWLGAFDDDGRLIGAVAWAEDADGVDIDRLVVDPMIHRRGAGRRLVQRVLSRAGGRPIGVSTGRDNLPARTLYQELGFKQINDTEVVPGLWVTHLALMP